jgi:hypothetical protein
MKVATGSDSYCPQLGGTTEHVHGQAAALTRRGHDVTVPNLSSARVSAGS